MKASLLVEPNRREIREVPVPSASIGEVLVRIREAGICGTDYALYSGDLPAKHPIIPGHEAVGEIVALGYMIYRDEFPAAIDLLARGAIDTKRLVSGTYPREEISPAFLDRHSSSRVKALIWMPD